MRDKEDLVSAGFNGAVLVYGPDVFNEIVIRG